MTTEVLVWLVQQGADEVGGAHLLDADPAGFDGEFVADEVDEDVVDRARGFRPGTPWRGCPRSRGTGRNASAVRSSEHVPPRRTHRPDKSRGRAN